MSPPLQFSCPPGALRLMLGHSKDDETDGDDFINWRNQGTLAVVARASRTECRNTLVGCY
jgi:hypothetical protein